MAGGRTWIAGTGLDIASPSNPVRRATFVRAASIEGEMIGLITLSRTGPNRMLYSARQAAAQVVMRRPIDTIVLPNIKMKIVDIVMPTSPNHR